MTKSKKSKKNPFIKFLKIFIITLLLIALFSIVAVSGLVLAIVKTSPPLDVSQILNLNETSVIYDDKGKAIDDVITTDENGAVIKRTIVKLNQMSSFLPHAFVSIEDERFYDHNGIDVKRIAGALYSDVLVKLNKKNANIQGASTITQQLIKNRMFLMDSLKNRTSPKRKIQEIYLSLKLEKSLSKDDIIEAYLNTIFLGDNAYGVEAASNFYFGKSSKNLNLIESAFLAGITQSPGAYSPFSTANLKDPSKYINRTSTVLYKMYEHKYISKDEYDKALADLKNKKLVFTKPNKNKDKYNYEWFSRPLIEQIKKDLKDQYHYTDTEVINLFMNGGLKIYSTMNSDLQNKSQDIINSSPILNGVSKKGKEGMIEPQASAVVVNYHTGEVKAIIGGRGDQPVSGYNRAIDFRRATGSSIKPITVYGAAIDSQLATAGTIVEDSPVSDDFANRYGFNGKPYYPKNDDNSFMGTLTLREALKYSRNVVACKLEDQIGLKTGIAYAKKFGIPIDDKTDANSISAIALGQLHGTNTFTMSSAYGVFGNNGMYTTPRIYTKVVDKYGRNLLQSKFTAKQIIAPESAYIMYDLLKGPTSAGGTGPSAKFGNMPVAGKTGTATDSKDLWFCGLTPYFSAAVWIGNDDWSKFYGLSSDSAAAIWGKIMAEATKGMEVKDIDMPANISKVKICKDSGRLATDLCEKAGETYTELFIDNSIPSAICDEHVEINVNKTNGKLSTELTPKNLIESRIILKKDMPQKDDFKPIDIIIPKDNNSDSENTPSDSNEIESPKKN